MTWSRSVSGGYFNADLAFSIFGIKTVKTVRDTAP
jgi:hypothetical protein